MYRKILGAFDFHTLYDRVVSEAPENSKLVEVGCLYGRSTRYLSDLVVESKKKLDLYAVDLFPDEIVKMYAEGVNEWMSEEGFPNFDEWFNENKNKKGVDVFRENVPGVNMIQGNSLEAHENFDDNSLFFVFIDTYHEFNHLCKEILYWFPKVQIGGYFAGHDWRIVDIKLAVKKYFEEKDIEVISPSVGSKTESFLIRKSSELANNAK